MRYLILLILLTSCSSPSNNKRFKVYDNYIVENSLEEINKINRFMFRGWAFLDNRHILLDSSHLKTFLITFTGYCTDLDSSNEITLDQAMTSSLRSKFDSIVIPNQQFQQKCRISTIHKVTKQQRIELFGLRKKSK